ncbi:MAG: hypothetical protein SFU27_13970 [Thermonemataceae bacterium]|nr:hypothetical protein [Thermonemataceae bacterium]
MNVQNSVNKQGGRTTKKTLDRNINWSKSRTYQYRGKNVVEVDIEFSLDGKKIIFEAASGDSLNVQANQSISRLVMYQQSNGTFQTYLMLAIGKKEYINKYGDAKRMERNQQNKWDTDFSGWILFLDWNENFVNGYEMDNGKIKNIAKRNLSTNNRGESLDNCQMVWIHTGWECERDPMTSRTEGAAPPPKIDPCIRFVELGYYELQCFHPSENPQNPGDPSGGGGNTTPTPTPTYPPYQPPVYPDPTMDCQGCLDTFRDNPELCDDICNGVTPPEMPPSQVLPSSELSEITQFFGQEIEENSIIMETLNNYISQFMVDHPIVYNYIKDAPLPLQWLSRDEFLNLVQNQDLEEHINNSLTINYLHHYGVHYMVFNNNNIDYNDFLYSLIKVYVQATEVPINYSEDDYPGRDMGYPFEWWNDESWIINNVQIGIEPQNQNITPEELKIILGLKIYWVIPIMVRNKGIAEQETRSRFGVNGLNDKSDAFRHAFFYGMNFRDFGYPAVLLGIAHESQVPTQLKLEKEMDLFNNKVGYSIVGGLGAGVTNNSFANACYDGIIIGRMIYLSPLSSTIDFFDPEYNPDGLNNIIPGVTQKKPTNQ